MGFGSYQDRGKSFGATFGGGRGGGGRAARLATSAPGAGTVQVIGDQAARRALKKISSLAVARRVTRQAVNRAITPALKAARRQAPVRVGTLKLSLGKRVKTRRRDGVSNAWIGARGKHSGTDERGRLARPVKYLHLVEFGTKAHEIPIKRGRFAGRTIKHPGTKAQHPIEKSWDRTKTEVQARVSRLLIANVEREARKAAAKGGKL